MGLKWKSDQGAPHSECISTCRRRLPNKSMAHNSCVTAVAPKHFNKLLGRFGISCVHLLTGPKSGEPHKHAPAKPNDPHAPVNKYAILVTGHGPEDLEAE